MAGININWGNSVKEFQKSLKEDTNDVEKEVNRITDKGGKIVLREVKNFTPVSTGKLRRNWRLVKRKKGNRVFSVIVNDLDYAKPVEYGTSKQIPRRMLTKAIARGKKYINKELNNLKRKLEGK